MPEVRIDVFEDNNTLLGTLDVSDHATFPLALNWSLADIKDITKRGGVFSKSFRLPATRNNNRVLLYLYKFQMNSIDEVYGKNVSVLVDGLPILLGKLKIKNVTQSQHPETYELELIGENLDWVDYLKKHSIKDIDYGNQTIVFDRTDGQSITINPTQHTHTLNQNFIEASWHGFPDKCDYLYSLKNYGAWKVINTQNSKPVVQMREMRPDISIAKIMRDSFTAAGYTLQSNFWQTDLAKSLVLGYTGNNFKLADGANNDLIFSAKYSLPKLFGGAGRGNGFKDTLKLDVATGNNYSTTTFKYTVPKDYRINFKAKLTIDINKWHERIKHFNIYIAKQIFTGTGSNHFNTSIVNRIAEEPVETGENKKGIVIELQSYAMEFKAGEVIVLGLDYVNNNRLWPAKNSPEFIIQKAEFFNEVERDILENDTYEVSSVLPEIGQLDVLSGVLNMFNLYFQTDTKNKVVTCEPRPDFYKDITTAVNWSEKLDVGNTITTQYIDSYKRTLSFQFKTDGKDGYAKYWTEQQGVLPGSLEYELPERFQRGTQKLDNKLFAYTFFITDNQLANNANNSGPNIPRLWERNESGVEASYEFEPRIMRYVGLLAENQTNSSGSSVPVHWQWIVDNNWVGVYPKMSMANISYDSASGLVKTYYQRDLAQMKDGRMLSAYFYLTASDILKLDLSKPVYIDHASFKGYYYINKIIDYKPLQHQVTKVELLPIVNNTSIVIDTSNNVDHSQNQSMSAGLAIGTGILPATTVTTTTETATTTSATTTTTVGANPQTPSIVLNNGTGNWAAAGTASVAIGQGILATGKNQTLLGAYNMVDADEVFQVGAGTSSADRYRGLTFTTDGNFLVQGGYMYTNNGQEILFVSQRNTAGQPARFDKLHIKGNK